jgi:hypothetical protein
LTGMPVTRGTLPHEDTTSSGLYYEDKANGVEEVEREGLAWRRTRKVPSDLGFARGHDVRVHRHDNFP